MSIPQTEIDNERVLRALGMILETRGIEPQGHTDRVATLASSIAAELGLSESEIRAIKLGAYLHDLGKLSVPKNVLLESKMLCYPKQIGNRFALMFGLAQP